MQNQQHQTGSHSHGGYSTPLDFVSSTPTLPNTTPTPFDKTTKTIEMLR